MRFQRGEGKRVIVDLGPSFCQDHAGAFQSVCSSSFSQLPYEEGINQPYFNGMEIDLQYDNRSRSSHLPVMGGKPGVCVQSLSFHLIT